MKVRSFRIPIHINPLFFVVAFFLGYIWSGGEIYLSFLLMGVVTLSVLVHEFGHALTGIVFHQKVTVSLLPFGGLTERKGKPLKSWQEFLIILMGPSFGFLLYLAAFKLTPVIPEGTWKGVVGFTATANLFWTVVNLLPVLPLDGGQLMRVLFQGFWGSSGLKAACLFSIAFGIFFGLAFVVRQDFLIASIFGIFVYESFQMYQGVKFLTDHDTNTTLQRLLTKGEKLYHKEEEEKGEAIFNKIREEVSKGLLYNHATLYLAKIADGRNDFSKVFSLLNPISKELSYEGILLLHKAAMHQHEWKLALDTGKKLYEVKRDPKIAQDNSDASKALGDTLASEGWLKAVQKGPNST